jgi:hypothetical protein
VDTLPPELREPDALTRDNHRPDGQPPTAISDLCADHPLGSPIPHQEAPTNDREASHVPETVHLRSTDLDSRVPQPALSGVFYRPHVPGSM